MKVARRLIGVWLMADGIWTGLWFAGLVESLGGRDAMSLIAISLRLIVAAVSVISGLFISQRTPAGEPLGIAALLLMAAFGIVDAATRVLPSNQDPSLQWPLAWVQAAIAIVAILLLRRLAREKM
ncbi:MAG TPA: hypothetical protein VMZ90_04570 [Vicinamibacterales bacterium]|nr:hypothetical protein [Vicinamibacterales bacterium]